MTITIILGLVVIALLLVVVAIPYTKTANTASAFYLMDGSLDWGGLLGTLLASNLSLGNMIIVCAVWGYFYGFTGLLWVCVCLIMLTVGFRVFAKSSPNLRAYVLDTNNSGTLHEYLFNYFKSDGRESIARAMRVYGSLTTMLCLFLAIALELHIAADLLASIVGSDLFLLVVVFAVLIAIYTSLGGFRTVVITDIVQLASFGAALIAAAFVLIVYKPVSWNELATTAGPFRFGFASDPGWPSIVGICFLGFGWLFVTMDTWQRNCASRSLDVTLKGNLWGGVLLVFAVALFAFFGMFVHAAVSTGAIGTPTSGGTNPIKDFFLLGSNAGTAGAFAFGIIAIGLIMAAISTTDTFLIVIGHSIIADLIIGVRHRQSLGNLSEVRQRLYAHKGRIIAVLLSFGVLAAWLALRAVGILKDPIVAFYVAYSIQFALFPLVWSVSFGSRRPAIAGLLAIVAGTVAAAVCGTLAAIHYNLETSETFWKLSAADWLGILPCIGAIASGAVLVVVSGICRLIGRNFTNAHS